MRDPNPIMIFLTFLAWLLGGLGAVWTYDWRWAVTGLIAGLFVFASDMLHAALTKGR